jgi:hypothetical protein
MRSPQFLSRSRKIDVGAEWLYAFLLVVVVTETRTHTQSRVALQVMLQYQLELIEVEVYRQRTTKHIEQPLKLLAQYCKQFEQGA